MNNLLSCKNLTLSYDKDIIINNMSLDFNSNGLYTLLGANGSGKSTFLKALLFDPDIKIQGSITINSEVLSNKLISQNIAFMPQSLDVPFPYSVLEIVMMGHKDYTYFLKDKKKIKAKALECLEELYIQDLQNYNIQKLSGGQKALVFIAKTLCKDSPIILLDEPDSALDFSNKLLLFDSLSKIKDKKTIIISSHDPLSILKYSDYILPIYKNSSYSPILANDINIEIIKNIYPQASKYNLRLEMIDGVQHLFNV